jgi:hypothetical protein
LASAPRHGEAAHPSPARVRTRVLLEVEDEPDQGAALGGEREREREIGPEEGLMGRGWAARGRKEGDGLAEKEKN